MKSIFRVLSFVLAIIMTFVIPASAETVLAEERLGMIEVPTVDPSYNSFTDPVFLDYVNDRVYAGFAEMFDGEDIIIESVQSVYISQEYLDEVAYNSKANVFFGYHLEELEERFQDTRYVFTLEADGTTGVELFENYDDSYEQALKNVAIGAGVILVCVSAVVLTDGATGFEAINMICAVGAKTGAEMGLGAGVIGALTESLITAKETGDWDQALRAGALKGSKQFKLWGIIGTGVGMGTEYLELLRATLNGLTLQEAAAIQKESELSLEFIKNFHSMAEYEIYKNAGLEALKLGGNWAFLRDIDLTSIVDSQGRTNVQRIIDKLSPLDPNGIAYELHHIGQKIDAPLAILTKAEHIQGGNYNILHYLAESVVEHGAEWETQVHNFWMSYLRYFGMAV